MLEAASAVASKQKVKRQEKVSEPSQAVHDRMLLTLDGDVQCVARDETEARMVSR